MVSVAATVPAPETYPVITLPITAELVRVTALLPDEVASFVKLAFVVTLLAVKAVAVPVMLVPTNALGVPRAGVTRTGDVSLTKTPVPVPVYSAEVE
jgi:hypothetical protein